MGGKPAGVLSTESVVYRRRWLTAMETEPCGSSTKRGGLARTAVEATTSTGDGLAQHNMAAVEAASIGGSRPVRCSEVAESGAV